MTTCNSLVMLISITLLILININSSSAFDFKSLLFGENHEEESSSNDDDSFASFGRQFTTERSFRSDIPCDKYICKDTETCVDKPIECPCRLLTDIKCIVGDWYTCVRGDESCDQLL